MCDTSYITVYAEELAVPGLYYIDNIPMDTSKLLKKLDRLPWIHVSNNSNSRLVQHYGYKYDYGKRTNRIDLKCDDFPRCIRILADFLEDICLELGITDNKYENKLTDKSGGDTRVPEFNQCIVNNYYTGQGIGPHIDVTSYGKVIGCFSIGSGTIMKFTYRDKSEEIYIRPNSLYIMSGDSRYKWYHSMPARKKDILNNTNGCDPKVMERGRRISITFRNVESHGDLKV